MELTANHIQAFNWLDSNDKTRTAARIFTSANGTSFRFAGRTAVASALRQQRVGRLAGDEVIIAGDRTRQRPGSRGYLHTPVRRVAADLKMLNIDLVSVMKARALEK